MLAVSVNNATLEVRGYERWFKDLMNLVLLDANTLVRN